MIFTILDASGGVILLAPDDDSDQVWDLVRLFDSSGFWKEGYRVSCYDGYENAIYVPK